MTWERQVIPTDTVVLHFLGYCRFEWVYLAQFANREIDAMLDDSP